MSETPYEPMENALEEAQRDLLKKLLANPIEFPETFKRWVGDYFATNIPLIPYGNILGSKVNIAKSGDYIATNEGPATSAYGNLATVGPSINGLADGVYVILWGANTTGGAHEGHMGISVNGDTPVDGEAAGSAYSIPIAWGRLVTLSNKHNNTVVCKYKGGQQSWARRWIVAIRVATGA